MRSIVLSGFMATGKSTVGPILAARLGVPFLDTDEELVREAGRSIAELWRDEGEAGFRSREQRLIETLLGDSIVRVLAFGGGAVTVKPVRHLALERSTLVTLTASPETIVARAGDPRVRPNLAVGSDPVARTLELLESREDAYGECHFTVPTDRPGVDPPSVAAEIAAAVRGDPVAMPLGRRTYVVDICVADPCRLRDAIGRLAPSSLVVVTDSHVARARGRALASALEGLSSEVARVTHVTLAPGEEHKTLANVGAIWDASLGAGVDRDALVLAFGGGVVGDMAGFAASALLRGVRCLQVPTTLLAMVDSSIGGKTGVDHPIGKNLIGAFHQPSGVVIDLDHLTTLPVRERSAGLAEVVKIALARDALLLESLERNAGALARGCQDTLLPIVRAAVEAKMRVVRDDERESGARALLNLGHTIGHALEAHGGYVRFLHGEAVALGTMVELEATARLGFTPRELVSRARDLFCALGLPTSIDAPFVEASWPLVASDKKRTRGAMKIPVVTGAGVAHVEQVALTSLRSALFLR